MIKRFYLSRQNLLKIIGIGATATLFLKILTNSLSNSTNKIDKIYAKEHEPKSYEKLISVQLITRHGARTPLVLIPGIDEVSYTVEELSEYVKAKVTLRTLGHTPVVKEISYYDQMSMTRKLKGGASQGMLTTIGEKQMFELGRRLKERYIKKLKFLPETYNQDIVYTRSSHFLRTIRSAKSVLAGLFTTDPNDSSSNFIIHAHRNEDDWIFPNSLICPLFGHIHANANKLPLLDTPHFVLELEELNKKLGIKMKDKNDFLSYTAFRDDLISRQTHNKSIPDDLLKYLEKSDLLAAMELYSVFEHNTQVSIGLFLNLILGNIQKAISKDTRKTVENVENHKFIYYSAHDSTIGAVLVALNKNNENKINYHWPPFGANIQIELWKNELEANNYFIRVFYLEKPLVLSQCNSGFDDKTKCDLNKFIKLIKLSSVDKEQFDKICSQPIDKYSL